MQDFLIIPGSVTPLIPRALKGPRGRCYTTRGNSKSRGGLGPGFASLCSKLYGNLMLAVRRTRAPRDGRAFPGAHSGAFIETLLHNFFASDVR